MSPKVIFFFFLLSFLTVLFLLCKSALDCIYKVSSSKLYPMTLTVRRLKFIYSLGKTPLWEETWSRSRLEGRHSAMTMKSALITQKYLYFIKKKRS